MRLWKDTEKSTRRPVINYVGGKSKPPRPQVEPDKITELMLGWARLSGQQRKPPGRRP